jgi:hypothetical protein
MIQWSREVIELAKLAYVRFSDLTESELKLLCAVTTGQVLQCGPTEAQWQHHRDPAFADFWGAERDILGEFISWLCANAEAASLVDWHGVRINGARITGNLELQFASVKFPLFLGKCRVLNELNFQFATMNFVSLSGSVTQSIRADGLVLKSIALQSGFRAEGLVSLVGACVGGNLDFAGGAFANPGGNALVADHAIVTGNALFNKASSWRARRVL